MPTLSIFFGVAIQMFWFDHAPPHFHAIYGEFEVQIAIHDRKILRGSLPPRLQAMVLEWAELNQDELLQAWEACSNGRTPPRIRPLV